MEENHLQKQGPQTITEEEPLYHKLILMCLIGLEMLSGTLQEGSLEIASFVLIKLMGGHNGERQWTRGLAENK